MFPDDTRCERCGQVAKIVLWTPIHARQPTAEREMQPELQRASCVINCPTCGSQAQVVCVVDIPITLTQASPILPEMSQPPLL